MKYTFYMLFKYFQSTFFKILRNVKVSLAYDACVLTFMSVSIL